MQARRLLAVLTLAAQPAECASSAVLDRQFQETVRPFVAKYCAACHSGSSPAAQFDLKSYTSLDMVTREFPHWELVMERLNAQEMPPKPVPPPPAEARQKVIDWIQAVRAQQVRKNAGDPGQVLPRRLSNAEYNYTIRDLTGQDLEPTREFPVDPANPAGFDNSGESLTISPALLNKYLQAARQVADHMYLTPDGFAFAPYPMLVETDRDKYSIERIVRFYLSQPTDFADYFEAAWRYQNRAALGKSSATLTSTAAEMRISAKYLPMVWGILTNDPDPVGPIAKLQGMFRALPAPGAAVHEELRAQTVAMRDFVVKIRAHTAMQFAAPIVRGLPPGSQALLDWKLYQFAAHRRDSDPKDLLNDTDPEPQLPKIPRYPELHMEAAPRWAALTARARAGDHDLRVPAAERARYEAAFERFAHVFPDAFYVKERGRYFPDDSEDKGRLLSASYHNTMGYFRDDAPLMELILDANGQKELNRLWEEFDFVAAYTARTWEQYFINQSGEVYTKDPEAGSPRPADHAITDEAVIRTLETAYLAKAAEDPKNDPIAPTAIRDHFDRVNATLRRLEKEHREAEPAQLETLVRFAERAYRRPLTKAESEGLAAYYRELREKNAMSHEDAIRTSIVGILMSPDFLYRIDLLDSTMGAEGPAARKEVVKSSATVPTRSLSPYALASRLSYFLWASMPDEELLSHAAAGDLEKTKVLVEQTQRMLKDERVRGFATEFGGNWLDFRHFETANSVDRDRFPMFTDKLRAAMFQEPVQFLSNLIRTNGSVLDLLYGDYTFVNPSLAKFYGMPEVTGSEDTWVRVDGAGKYDRGGILPMAVFLTQNSPGLRTSPVKRGYWVVHRVIGQIIPPPPPVVPELPADESKTDLPLRDMLAQHRSNQLCAACHSKFDSFGLAFEGYGPVGEARTEDLAGRPVDVSAAFPNGTKGEGLAGLRNYIHDNRQSDFIDNLNRKLLAYALNRSLQVSDESLVARMNAALPARNYDFDTLVEAIVTSPQFRNSRVPPPDAIARGQGRDVLTRR